MVGSGDVEIEISIPNGEQLAEKTLNARLGIKGGLSILGTTGIVVPYSCAAWIATIHQGIDVAGALGLTHVAGATGRSSEAAIAKMYNLPDSALIDMGDFVGGMLKYLRAHPIPHVTIAGGVGKMTKLAQGLLDLHSARGSVDLQALATLAREAGGSETLAERIVALEYSGRGLRSRARRRHRSRRCSRQESLGYRGGGASRYAHRSRNRGVRPRWRLGRPCRSGCAFTTDLRRDSGGDNWRRRARWRGSLRSQAPCPR